MFEQFSSGYYLGRLYVEPHVGARAVMRETHYEQVQDQLYGGRTVEGVDGLEADTPLVMRFDQQHFVVDGDTDVPEQTLAVPRDWLDPGHDPLEPREVFLAKADRAEQLLQFAVESDDAQSGDGSHDGGGPPGSPFIPRAFGEVDRPGSRLQ